MGNFSAQTTLDKTCVLVSHLVYNRNGSPVNFPFPGWPHARWQTKLYSNQCNYSLSITLCNRHLLNNDMLKLVYCQCKNELEKHCKSNVHLSLYLVFCLCFHFRGWGHICLQSTCKYCSYRFLCRVLCYEQDAYLVSGGPQATRKHIHVCVWGYTSCISSHKKFSVELLLLISISYCIAAWRQGNTDKYLMRTVGKKNTLWLMKCSLIFCSLNWV